MRKEPPSLLVDEVIMNKIYFIRGQKVMLDTELAELYQLETKRLKEQVKRNLKRFPKHFMFELTDEETKILRSQFATLGLAQGQYSKYRPYAFSEYGILMLSNVLKSDRAIDVSIKIIDIFIKLRNTLSDNIAVKNSIEKLEKQVGNNTKNIELVFHYLDELTEQKSKPRKQIGYKAVKK